MRIGLNLLHAVPDIGGGWNYIQNLMALLGRADRTNEYVAFVTGVSRTLVPEAANFRARVVPIRSGVRMQRVVFEHTGLQALVKAEHLDCLHWFANGQGIVNAAPAVVTIYDLQPFLDHVPLSRAKGAYLRWRLRATVKSAEVMLPMSETTRCDLHRMLGADPARMIVIPPVLEPTFRPPTAAAVQQCRRAYDLPRDFWLYVAHWYPHKNHDRLLQAYRALRAQDPSTWPLVLRGDFRGAPLDLGARIAELGLTGHVIVLPRLTREELTALYGAASALVFPSLYEGGGMPVLEAQACGCPVVVSDIPALREFAGEAARYFAPRDIADIERSMSAIAQDARERDRLRGLGLERARLFRSVPVIDRLLEAYERASGTRLAATSANR